MRWVSDQQLAALPQNVQNYIHDLHANYEPRGHVRQQAAEVELWRRAAMALTLENTRLRRVIERIKHRETKTS